MGGLYYILEWFFEVGPVLSSGMGPTPLSFTELRHWRDLVNQNVKAWEMLVLRKMSQAYVIESATATDLASPPPFTGVLTDHRRDSIDAGLRSILDRRTRKGAR